MKFAPAWARIKKEAALLKGKIPPVSAIKLNFEDQKLFWISGGLFLLLQGTLALMLWRVAPPWEIVMHQLSYNLDDFLVTRDNWGPEKVRFFLQHYWIDFFYPAVYAVYFRCLLTQIQLSYPTSYVFHALSFPVAAAIYDEIENICQMALVAGWTESKFVFYLGAFGAYGKWMLLMAIIGAAVYALTEMYWERSLEK